MSPLFWLLSTVKTGVVLNILRQVNNKITVIIEDRRFRGPTHVHYDKGTSNGSIVIMVIVGRELHGVNVEYTKQSQ